MDLWAAIDDRGYVVWVRYPDTTDLTLVGQDAEDVEAVREHATKAAVALGKRLRLVRFTPVETLAVFEPGPPH